jgi:hypothetical protein
VHGSATIQQDHVQTVGERWEILSQCVIRHLSSKITYYLWSGSESQSSQCHCVVLQLSSKLRTHCGRAMEATESVRGSATTQQGRVQAVGKRWERQSQCVVRLLSYKITYRLFASGGRDKCQWVELLAANGRYSQLGVFFVQRDHGPSASWQRPRGIEFKVSRSVYCLERKRKCGTNIEQFFVLSFSMRWIKF